VAEPAVAEPEAVVPVVVQAVAAVRVPAAVELLLVPKPVVPVVPVAPEPVEQAAAELLGRAAAEQPVVAVVPRAVPAQAVVPRAVPPRVVAAVRRPAV
jgi:hypothetical protein